MGAWRPLSHGRRDRPWSLESLVGAVPTHEDSRNELPLDWHPDWLHSVGDDGTREYRLLRLRDANSDSAAVSDVVIEASRARSLPGHWIWRVLRFPCSAFAARTGAVVEALADAARQERFLLRCRLHLFATDESRLRRAIDEASRAGFRRAAPESYSRTVLLDIDKGDDALLQSLDGRSRRHIKRVLSSEFSVAGISDTAAFSHRLAELEEITKSRTGGRYATQRWARWLELAAARPDLARVAGLFQPGDQTPQQLIGFALGCRHGNLVEYRSAATSRLAGVKLPLAYGPAWDLIRWARDGGASLFDFGGAVDSSAGESHPLVKISRFKRNFNDRITRVAQEMVLEPHPRRAKAATRISRVARLLS